MISASSSNLTNIWSHAKNVREDFIRYSSYREPPTTPSYSFDLFGENGYYYYYYDNENTSDITTTTEAANVKTFYYLNSDSECFIDHDNIERNYKNLYSLLNKNYNDTADTQNVHSMSKKFMKNGALIFVFLNSNPKKVRDKYLERLFMYEIVQEDPYKAALMLNQLVKEVSTAQKDISTDFFTKLASLIEFQYNLPRSYDHPLTTNNFSIDIQNVQGLFIIFFKVSLYWSFQTMISYRLSAIIQSTLWITWGTFLLPPSYLFVLLTMTMI